MNVSSRNLLAALAFGAAACAKDTPKAVATTDTAVGAAKATTKTDTAGSSATLQLVDPPAYVGTHYDPLPRGVSYEGGSVLMGKDGKPSAFALTHVLTPRGNYMWLDSLLPNDGQSQLRSRIVRAELKVRKVTGDEVLLIGSCDVKGKLDAGVVAIAERQYNAKHLTHIRNAWRADPSASSFVALAPADVVCEDPGM